MESYHGQKQEREQEAPLWVEETVCRELRHANPAASLVGLLPIGRGARFREPQPTAVTLLPPLATFNGFFQLLVAPVVLIALPFLSQPHQDRIQARIADLG